MKRRYSLMSAFVIFTLSILILCLVQETFSRPVRVRRILVVRARISGVSYDEANKVADRHAKSMLSLRHIVAERQFWPEKIIKREGKQPDKDGWVVVRYTIEGRDYPAYEVAYSWWDFP